MNGDYDLLQEAIELTPRNPNNSRNCETTVEILARLIHSFDEQDGLSIAQAIFDHFCLEGTTPSEGYLSPPGYKPYPYEPHRIVVGNDGTYKLKRESTFEYLFAEIERVQQRAERVEQHAEQMHWISYVCTPLRSQFPDAPFGEIIKLLPEPDRTIAEKIVYGRIPDEALPLERTHRGRWHERIEEAIFVTLPHQRKQGFSIDDILAVAGIDETLRLYASEYAERIMDVMTNYSADVTLPRFPQTVSRGPQLVQ